MANKRAFISVYKKEGIVEFARELSEKYGYSIVSTGGTYETLKQKGINAIEISEITGFTELLGGRVKSLHPKIHAGILANRAEDRDMLNLSEHGIDAFDMVVVNLYPFEEAAKDCGMDVSKLIEYIDIGGVTLLRAAAKNFFYVTSVYSPSLYSDVLENMAQNGGEVDYDLRKKLAIETYLCTSSYDGLISAELSSRLTESTGETLPDVINMNLKKTQDLRYGENPHQQAAVYSSGVSADFEQLNGKELSYNNLVDMTAALNIVSEFDEASCACIIKHGNPCGVALGESIDDAFMKALECDPISAFGGIVGLSKPVTKTLAIHIKDIFFEVIIAPDFDADALEILSSKKNLRLIKVTTPLEDYKKIIQNQVKILPFGTLVQSYDRGELSGECLKIATSHKPTEESLQDMLFAWKVAKHVNSNAIVVVKDLKTVGIGCGQTSRIASMEIALNQACDETKDAVIASDGFFPAIDNVHAAAQARIAAIIQPGGSIKDSEVVAEAEKHGISMLMTSIRHFKH